MNYAVVKTGGKQYRVKPGDLIDVEKLPVEEGSSIELTDVLAVSRNSQVVVGTPLVPDAAVLAQVRAQSRDKKIIVFKYKRKVRYRRKKGHRQHYTRLFITAIKLDGEEIGIPEQAEPEIIVQQEPAVEQVSDELEGQAEDELSDETTDAAEEQIAVEGTDEVVDELPAPSADEPPPKPQRKPQSRRRTKVIDEVPAPSADEPKDEGEK